MKTPGEHPRTPSWEPKVTIAIPTKTRLAYLRLAVESARAQSYDNIEIIVSNNFSEDETAEYLDTLEESRLIVLNQTAPLSMVENWNVCVEKATGEYFILLSDDDILECCAIASLLEGYAHKDRTGTPPGIVYASGRIIDSAGSEISIVAPGPRTESSERLILRVFRGEQNVLLCSVLFRREDIRDGFPLGFTIINDAAMWMSVLARYTYAFCVPEQLVQYRIHASNLSTAATGEVWTKEIRDLASLVVANTHETGLEREEFVRSVTRVGDIYGMGAIAANINRVFATARLGGIIEYARKQEFFRGIRGKVFLMRGVILLFTPQSVKRGILYLRFRLRLWRES